MIEKLLDYLTLRFDWIYRLRRWWCKSLHAKKSRHYGEDGVMWHRTECTRCGFWEEVG